MSINIRHAQAEFALILLLVGCSRDPADELLAKLQSADVEVRRAATRELVETPLHDERIVAALSKSVADPDADVRHAAMDALGKSGPSAKAALPALKAALQDQEPALRIRAAWAIVHIDPHDRSFMPVLTTALRAGDGWTLLEVAALGPSAAWAAPTLTELLAHPSPKVRTLAANGLGAIGAGANRSLAALQRAAKDPEAIVRHAAEQAIAKVSSTVVPPGAN